MRKTPSAGLQSGSVRPSPSCRTGVTTPLCQSDARVHWSLKLRPADRVSFLLISGPRQVAWCIFSSRLGVTLAFNGTAVSSVTGAANVSETVDKKQTERKKNAAFPPLKPKRPSSLCSTFDVSLYKRGLGPKEEKNITGRRFFFSFHLSLSRNSLKKVDFTKFTPTLFLKFPLKIMEFQLFFSEFWLLFWSKSFYFGFIIYSSQQNSYFNLQKLCSQNFHFNRENFKFIFEISSLFTEVRL